MNIEAVLIFAQVIFLVLLGLKFYKKVLNNRIKLK
jgi:hypothetical protein